MTQQKPSFTAFFSVKYWPTWLGLFVLYVIAYSPFFLRIKIGSILGYLSYLLAKERRYITQKNFELCFPELKPKQQAYLTKKCFRENGIGLIETTTGWIRGPQSFKGKLTLKGTEHMDAALAEGKGVLLLGAHYTTLDFCAGLLSLHYPFGTTYRPHKNALFDAFMYRGRQKYSSNIFDRKNIRGAFKYLRKGGLLWYAPDQDYGPDHAVYSSFFNQPAATITAASRFASFNHSPALLIRHQRRGDHNHYEMEFIPLPKTFPSEDEQDALLINQMLEAAIRVCPEQYLWMHKRFKTQAHGKPDSPYIKIQTPKKTITAQRYQQLLSGSESIDSKQTSNGILRLTSGYYLQIFPGKAGFIKRRHQAYLFDNNSKTLRNQGIQSVTCDVLYQVPTKNLIAASFYKNEGELLSTIHKSEFPIVAVARLFIKLHQKGFLLQKINLEKLRIDSKGKITIENPEEVKILPFPISYLDRRDNIFNLFAQLDKAKLENKQKNNFITHYLDDSPLLEKPLLIDLLTPTTIGPNK